MQSLAANIPKAIIWPMVYIQNGPILSKNLGSSMSEELQLCFTTGGLQEGSSGHLVCFKLNLLLFGTLL
jgi:hypothetical protein